jgi:Flp pilus assembly protein TadG
MVEFGLISPVMLLLLMGTFDVGHSLYMRSVLEGAVQKAARDAGLESGVVTTRQESIDNKVKAQVLHLANNANVTITRRFYRSFTDAAAKLPETFTDNNGNGRCDNGEPYSDRNNNNVYDADGASQGQGNAQDSVLYTVALSYPRMFPLHGLIGLSPTTTIKATTVMNNQPYGDQANDGAATARNCPLT